ncbi:type II toxin-antitoxin system RelE/ParE family toxin [Rhizobium sp. CG5]|uniref:type II toxin-antitoxin system RelE/ParE family toxin n=1 Tax=Rhizobium sp. CG5 TaxID=2726076 RepID=UPI0020340293|nr:type II toxin-antitoxin system RelE/ParE family toxin [Rhizobium sp. CG5]MCM2473994.1 type II toxin-antitoxin system RelE/ParE family toxin [Rhizobium sp. CG5]
MSLRALDDLLNIYNHIAQFNPVAARRLLDDLNAKMAWMADSGVTGVPRAYLPGLRAFPYRNRIIYFVVSDDHLTVMRVLHGHQNITPDDFTESSS